jgi:hypothetical protein
LVSSAAASTGLQRSMIFGRVDDASIITGIQQACAELRQCSGSNGGAAAAAAVGSPVAGSSSSSALGRSPFSPGDASQEQQRCEAAAAAAVHKSVSEPMLQQWASDGLQPLGEPSWARMGRQQSSHHSSQPSSHPRSASRQGSLGACDRERCAVDGGGSSSNAHGGSSSTAGGGDAGKSTVSALECDLKNTARLYPPGR